MEMMSCDDDMLAVHLVTMNHVTRFHQQYLTQATIAVVVDLIVVVVVIVKICYFHDNHVHFVHDDVLHHYGDDDEMMIVMMNVDVKKRCSGVKMVIDDGDGYYVHCYVHQDSSILMAPNLKNLRMKMSWTNLRQHHFR